MAKTIKFNALIIHSSKMPRNKAMGEIKFSDQNQESENQNYK